MKFFKIVSWWILFTIIWWGLVGMLIYSLSPVVEWTWGIGLSPRTSGFMVASTYGLGAYVILSVFLIIGLILWYRKKK